MYEQIKEPVSVVLTFNHETRSISPRKLQWHGREYPITKIGYHYKVKDGNTLYHFFTVCSHHLFFKLRFNTDNLHWQLDEFYDESTS